MARKDPSLAGSFLLPPENKINMAIVKCSECSREVSDKAPSCPNCGNPIGRPVLEVATNPSKPFKVELELTNKKWKKVILIAWFVIVGGLLILTAGEEGLAPGGILIFFGIVGLIVGKIGAWYSNR